MTAENGTRKKRKEVEKNKGNWMIAACHRETKRRNIFSEYTWEWMNANLLIFKLNF